MTTRDGLYNEIEICLTQYAHSVKNMAKQNLNSDAVNSEHFFSEILNEIKGLALSKKGLKNPNQKAIDTHDLSNKVCAQFTVVNNQAKFEKTIRGVESLNESGKYQKLIFLVIGFDVGSRNHSDNLGFSVEQLDITALLRLINENFSTSSKIAKIHELITTELKSYISRDSLHIDNTTKIERTKKGRTISACLLKSEKEISDISINVLIAEPNLKFKEVEVIIVSIMEGTYDEALKKDSEDARYFFCNLYDMSNSGLEVLLQRAIGSKVIINQNGEWQELNSSADPTEIPEDFQILQVKKIGHIPFYNVAAIDERGDYLDDPVIYCRFSIEGWPFDEIRFKPFFERDWIRFLSTNGYLDLKKQRSDLI